MRLRSILIFAGCVVAAVAITAGPGRPRLRLDLFPVSFTSLRRMGSFKAAGSLCSGL
jgi:hypothetical protein